MLRVCVYFLFLFSGKLLWDEGGWQEARGSASNGGGEWYLENSLTLMDYPLEWFYCRMTGFLYLSTHAAEVCVGVGVGVGVGVCFVCVCV